MTPGKALPLLCLLLLASCASPTMSNTSTPTPIVIHSPTLLPDTLLVTRISTFPQNHIPPLTPRTVRNALAVQRLYLAAYQLPHYPNGTTFCPVDYGIAYHLTFLRESLLLLQAELDAGGCRELALGPGDGRMTNDAFWALFASVAGIPPNELQPVPQEESG